MKDLSLLITGFTCAALLLSGCAEKKRDSRAAIVVKTIPDKADVTLMKQQIGPTPCGCRLPAGIYLLKIEKPNHETCWEQVS